MGDFAHHMKCRYCNRLTYVNSDYVCKDCDEKENKLLIIASAIIPLIVIGVIMAVILCSEK